MGTWLNKLKISSTWHKWGPVITCRSQLAKFGDTLTEADTCTLRGLNLTLTRLYAASCSKPMPVTQEFPGILPFKHCPGPVLLNFCVQMWTGPSNMAGPLTLAVQDRTSLITHNELISILLKHFLMLNVLERFCQTVRNYLTCFCWCC